MNQPQLAIDGGTEVFPDGPPPWPIADDDVLHNVQLAMADGSWGKYEARWTTQLIEKLGQVVRAEHVLLCSSGTIAVEVALRAMDISAQEEVVLAAYDFPGNFRAIEAIGARPVIVDVVENGWVIDPEQLQAAITDQTKAVIVSHLHGQIADCHRIREICDHSGIAMVEDVCQCPGGFLDDQPLGTLGDVAIFSFGGSKLLSSGRGGALTTNNPDVYQRAKIYCNRGNEAFPLSQLQAATLLPQIDKLDACNQIRNQRVRQLYDATDSIHILRSMQQVIESNFQPAFYKVPWLIDIDRSNWTRDEFIKSIQAEGVAIDVGFRGFTRRSTRRCRHVGNLIHSRIAAQQTIILHHPVLLESENIIELVAMAIEKVGNSRV